jgi:hypothetical protein
MLSRKLLLTKIIKTAYLLKKNNNERCTLLTRSYHHNIFTEEINKVALSADDDKQVIMQDGIHTLAYGHYNLNL